MIIQKQKKDGSFSYKVKIYVEGKQVTKTFRRKADAQQWERQMIVDRERGLLRPENPEAQKPLREFACTWLETHLGGRSPKTRRSYEMILRLHILPVLGEMKLNELRMKDGLSLVNHLRDKGKSPKGINMATGLLKGILNDAVKHEILTHNPLRHLSQENVPPKAAKFWMPDEVEQFLRANRDDELYELWVVALNTGMRRGELAGLKWDKVDFRNRLIHVARTRDREGLRESTKTHSSFRYIPMNEACEEALSSLQSKRYHAEYVFAHKEGNIVDVQHLNERHFRKAIKRAGVPKIRFHDLRGTFASNVCMAPGGDLFGLSKILGHSKVEMTVKRYAHLHNSFLKQVAMSVNFKGD